ncbi:MAG: hypothetical protein ACC657_17345, partial [Thiohalomonadales bacterium]
NAKGERIQLSHMQVGEANFSTIMVKELVLTDFSIIDNANFNNALAKESQVSNFKIKSGAKIKMDGTNINFH